MSSSAQGTSSACPGRKGLTKLPGCDRLQTGKFTRQKDEPGQHGYCPALSGAKEVKGDFLDTLGKGSQPSSRALLCPWQPHILGGNTEVQPWFLGRSPCSARWVTLSPAEDVMLLPAEVSQPHSHVTQEPRGTTRCAEKLSAVHHFAQDVLKSGRGPDFQQKSVLPLWAVKYLGGRLCFASCLSLRAE